MLSKDLAIDFLYRVPPRYHCLWTVPMMTLCGGEFCNELTSFLCWLLCSRKNLGASQGTGGLRWEWFVFWPFPPQHTQVLYSHLSWEVQHPTLVIRPCEFTHTNTYLLLPSSSKSPKVSLACPAVKLDNIKNITQEHNRFTTTLMSPLLASLYAYTPVQLYIPYTSVCYLF